MPRRRVLVLLALLPSLLPELAAGGGGGGGAAPRTPLRGLYLGWVGQYNTGDDVVYQAAATLLAAEVAARHGRGTTLFPYLPPFPCAQASVALDAYDFVVLGGGSVLTQDEYACQLDAARSSGTPLLVFGSGWDPRGDLIALVQDVQATLSAGKEGATMSMSLTDAWKSRFRRATDTGVGGVRGPLTLAAVRSTAPQSLLAAIGDSGILVPLPRASVRGTRPWFLPPRPQNRREGEEWVVVGFGENEGASIFHNGRSAALETAWEDLLVGMVESMGLRRACDGQIVVQHRRGAAPESKRPSGGGQRGRRGCTCRAASLYTARARFALDRASFRLRESVDQLQASRERDVGRDGHAVRRHGVPHEAPGLWSRRRDSGVVHRQDRRDCGET